MVRLLSLLALALALAGCSSPGSSLPPVPEAAAGPYRLDTGDTIRMIVFGQQDLTGQFIVGDNGTVAVPLIGIIPARGATASELGQRVGEALVSQNLLVNPSVSVEVVEFRPFFILGEVRQPGRYPYIPNMTALTAVAVGGGFTYRAQEDLFSITRVADGRAVEGRAERDTLVRPGDVITVFERNF